jgi:hypothetical protein
MALFNGFLVQKWPIKPNILIILWMHLILGTAFPENLQRNFLQHFLRNHISYMIRTEKHTAQQYTEEYPHAHAHAHTHTHTNKQIACTKIQCYSTWANLKEEGSVGRPKMRWLDDVEENLRMIRISGCRGKARRRDERKSVLMEVKVLKGP